MSWKTNVFLCASIYAGVSLEAATERTINEKIPIEVVFSRTSHNRISVDGGVVEKIIGDGSAFVVTLDKSTGNAFINVLQDLPKPKTLTVVTGAGFIQDLYVSSQDRPSEQIILKEEESFEESAIRTDIFSQSATIEMLNKILEGKVPFGYGQRPITQEDAFDLPSPLIAETLKAFEGPLDQIIVYQIKNESKQTVVIGADSLKKENHSWVFLNAQELGNQKKALCIIAYPKE